MDEPTEAVIGSASRRFRAATCGAALSLLALALTWGIAAHVPAARLSDAAALRGFIGLDRPIVDTLSTGVLDLINPVFCTLFGLAAMAVAVHRGRRRLALAIPVILIGAVVSAEILKPLLAVPHAFIAPGHQVPGSSWPSGHSTAAMTMTLCALLVAAPRWRPAVAAVGGVLTLAVGFATLTLAWHMPSDVIGGFLLAGLWVSAAVAVLSRAEARASSRAPHALALRRARRASRLPAGRRPDPAGTETLVPGVVLGSVFTVALAIVVLRPTEVANFASAHHSVVAFATVITALATTLVSGFTVALRR